MRKCSPILSAGPVRHTAEAAHPLRHIGLEAHSSLFAVVDLIDANLHLLTEDMADSSVDGRIQRGGIYRFASFLIDQHAPQRFTTRQTACVRHKDAVLALLHVAPPLNIDIDVSLDGAPKGGRR